MDHLIDDVAIELSVVLGQTHMPIHQLLRMGRGAVIELEETEYDQVRILANNMPIARGEVVVRGDKIAIQVTHVLSREELRAGAA